MSLNCQTQNQNISGGVCAQKIIDKKVHSLSFCRKYYSDTFEKQEDKQSQKNKSNKLTYLAVLALLGFVFVAPAIKNYKKLVDNSMQAYSKNVREALEYKNFSKIKYFKDFNFFQKIKSIYKLKKAGVAEEFFATLNGNKPACYFSNKQGLTYLEKNKEFLADFDVICNKQDYLIFNKKKLREIISNNKDIYSTRLGLKKDATVEDIYNNLLNPETFNKDASRHDLLGITLGFSKYSSMMFELEQMAQLSYLDRNNPSKYKEVLLKILRGENSPYKNLNKVDYKKLEKCIESYTGQNISFNKGCYNFVNLANDSKETVRIEEEIRKFLEEFSPKKFEI